MRTVRILILLISLSWNAWSQTNTFPTTGNVGIGTINATSLLHINGGDVTLIDSSGSLSPDINLLDKDSQFISRIVNADNIWGRIELYDQSQLKIRLSGRGNSYINSGNVGIGTTDPKSKLAVEGEIRATTVKVLGDISVPDYVFEMDYELRTLKETKEYINENKHLPEIPSAAEIGKNGIDLGDMNMRLLKKIEELTLYQIELMERLEKLELKVK